MNRKYRKTVIAGNWKMHKTASETRTFLDALKGALPRMKRCSVVLCVPYVDIPAAAKSLRDSRIAVGAQNLHWAKEGAFTGEISAAMLAASLGFGVLLSAAFVLVFQGALVLLATFIAPFLTTAAIAELTCCGSVLILAIGFNLTGLTNFKVADYLPALLFVPFLTWAAGFLPI